MAQVRAEPRFSAAPTALISCSGLIPSPSGLHNGRPGQARLASRPSGPRTHGDCRCVISLLTCHREVFCRLREPQIPRLLLTDEGDWCVVECCVSHSSPKTGLDPISCHAAQERSARAPFIKERRMECINATSLHRKSGQWGTQRSLAMEGGRVSWVISLPGRAEDGRQR